jgi:hypothetical protein
MPLLVYVQMAVKTGVEQDALMLMMGQQAVKICVVVVVVPVVGVDVKIHASMVQIKARPLLLL